MRSSPFSIQIARLQMRRSAAVECETMSTAAPALDELTDALLALFPEKAIADTEHLIEDEHPGHLAGSSDGKSQPRHHARRIMTHLFFHEALQAGKSDDLRIMRVEKSAAVSADGAIEIDILPAAELMVKARAQRQQCEALPANTHFPRAWRISPADDAQQRALA